MSSVAICALLTRIGYSPIMQISCRDYNRIAIQGNVLGAAALGVCNILCLTGDGVQCGDHPEAKPVFDLDSTSLLQTIRTMRDEQALPVRPQDHVRRRRCFLGAAENPFAPPYDFRPIRLAKKIAAGAQFCQTQYCFDVPLLKQFMTQVRDMGLDEHCFILVGVGPLASARTARWMRANVAGVHIPDAIIARLEGAAEPEGRGQADLHRADPGDPRDPRRLRRPRHGLPPGGIRLRDRSRSRACCAAARRGGATSSPACKPSRPSAHHSRRLTNRPEPYSSRTFNWPACPVPRRIA